MQINFVHKKQYFPFKNLDFLSPKAFIRILIQNRYEKIAIIAKLSGAYFLRVIRCGPIAYTYVMMSNL